MYGKQWCVGVLILLAGSFAHAQEAERAPTFEIIPSTLFEQVVFIHEPEADWLNLDLIFPYGEIDNPYEEGLLHYAEHLAWHNAYFPNAKVGEALEERESAKGSNAYTGRYATGYVAGSNSQSFRNDLLQLLHASAPIELDEGFALSERAIVLREYSRRSESSLRDVYDSINRALFQDAPLARSVIGQPDEIQKFDLERAKLLHQRTHQLGEATLVIYGAIPRHKVIEVIGSFNPRQAEVPVEPLVKNRDLSNIVQSRDFAVMETEAVQTQRFVYRKLLPVPDCGTAARCNILMDVLNRAAGGRSDDGLAAVLVYDEFLATKVGFNLGVFDGNVGQISLSVTADVGVSGQELETYAMAAWRNLLTHGVSVDAFERAVDGLFLDQRETIKWEEELASTYSIMTGQLFHGEPIHGFWDQVDALEALSIEDVNAYLAEWNAPGREVVRHLIPAD